MKPFKKLKKHMMNYRNLKWKDKKLKLNTNPPLIIVEIKKLLKLDQIEILIREHLILTMDLLIKEEDLLIEEEIEIIEEEVEIIFKEILEIEPILILEEEIEISEIIIIEEEIEEEGEDE